MKTCGGRADLDRSACYKGPEVATRCAPLRHGKGAKAEQRLLTMVPSYMKLLLYSLTFLSLEIFQLIDILAEDLEVIMIWTSSK